MSDQCGAKICVEIKIARVHRSIRSFGSEKNDIFSDNFLDGKTLDELGNQPKFFLYPNIPQCQSEVYT